MIKRQLNEMYKIILETDRKFDFNILNKNEIAEKLEYVHDLDEVDAEINNLLQEISATRIKNKIAGDLITLRRNLLDYDSCFLDARVQIKKIIKEVSQ